MGAYLSKPITEKVSSDQVGKNVAYGASSMQGWRISQEDAHNACIEFDEDASLFAVYDGHGGHEVAAYCAKNLPDFIKSTEAYKKGDIKQALIDAFLGFDATLTKPDVISILKEIAGTKEPEKEKENNDDSDDEENISNLCMEATMPLEQVMAKYQAEILNPQLKGLKNDVGGSRVCSASPYLRSRKGKERASCSSSGAGCSSSSSSWNTNDESDVSSSSQPCGSSASTSADRKGLSSNSPKSSEAEQVLDSTTSNGEVAQTSERVASTGDATAAVAAAEICSTKSVDMPDSSEDVKDKVSPSKVSQPEPSSPSVEAEVNGASLSKNFGDADSSRAAADSVTSSSCIPVENGEAEQQENISSSIRRRNQRMIDYKELLADENPISDDDGDEDEDDEENDESFMGVRGKRKEIMAKIGTEDSDDDDDDDDDEEEEEEEEEEEDDDDDDEDDDDEDEDDEEDDEDEDEDMEDVVPTDLTEEPGSDSGCTAVVAVLKGTDLYVANAGDSRCVLCRDGQALELSLDHKPEDQPEMSRIVKAGGKVTADGRVNGGLNLSRALGDHAYKQNATLPAQEQMISALPDIRHATIDPKKDEFMVIACDGIWNFMSSQDVIQFVRTRLKQDCQNISKICEELFDHCLAPNTLGDGTGCDNMTAVIVQFKSSLSNDVSNSTADQPVTKKRPISPSKPDASSECVAHESVIEECKRQKTEAV
ncbi:probable protein phosphatase CG10417 [Belonocnema kinseyi]|uniref:probable protein phosphatase CG10417 n=1 Tax=Belonocnema kinseyi TaxID=2817044 RepID=UPI00143D8C5F|nr:probable protein phosphatase CG10417 [Belonocnema kinseyi]